MKSHHFAWRPVQDKTVEVDQEFQVDEHYEVDAPHPTENGKTVKVRKTRTVKKTRKVPALEKQPPRHELKIIEGDQARYVRDLQATLGDDYAEFARQLERLDKLAK